MSSLALMLLVLFLSLHACTARPLSLTKKYSAKYHFDKGLDKVKLSETLTASSSTEVIVGVTSGAEVTISFQADSPSSLSAKEMRHGQSMLVPAQHHVEKIVIPNVIDTIQENMGEIDYEQPHPAPSQNNHHPHVEEPIMPNEIDTIQDYDPPHANCGRPVCKLHA